jgi:hypothetical protein
MYGFEYRWTHEGVDMEKRLRYFEERWPYFLGEVSIPDFLSHMDVFVGWGMPIVATTYFVPPFVGAGVFALVFPVVSERVLCDKKPRIFPTCTVPHVCCCVRV